MQTASHQVHKTRKCQFSYLSVCLSIYLSIYLSTVLIAHCTWDRYKESSYKIWICNQEHWAHSSCSCSYFVSSIWLGKLSRCSSCFHYWDSAEICRSQLFAKLKSKKITQNARLESREMGRASVCWNSIGEFSWPAWKGLGTDIDQSQNKVVQLCCFLNTFQKAQWLHRNSQ
jgi:hypothetical protein